MWAVWIIVGVAVGWHLPQPQYAKDLETRLVAWIKSKT